MKIKSEEEHKFYGTTSIGKKGQMVVPIEARRSLNVKEGEKLLVFGMGRDMIAVMKLSQIEEFASMLTKKLKTIENILNKKQ
ncbi:MAG: AbrB/MazE/SpoVT family DNA-binding domain-containing protein [Minisyncoccia bacterium]